MFLLEDEAGLAMRFVWSVYLGKVRFGSVYLGKVRLGVPG